MPDALFPHLYSAERQQQENLRASGRRRKAERAETTLEFAPSPTSNPKYFIETLKYFMDEDLKLGFFTDESQLGMEIEAKFCMHQHE